MAEKRAEPKAKKPFSVTLNEKTVNLADAFPMRLRDWKELEANKISLTEMDGSADSVSKLVQHFMTKANPEVTMEDVDELTMKELMQAVQFIQEESAGEEPDPN